MTASKCADTQCQISRMQILGPMSKQWMHKTISNSWRTILKAKQSRCKLLWAEGSASRLKAGLASSTGKKMSSRTAWASTYGIRTTSTLFRIKAWSSMDTGQWIWTIMPDRLGTEIEWGTPLASLRSKTGSTSRYWTMSHIKFMVSILI